MLYRVQRFERTADGWWTYDYTGSLDEARARVRDLQRQYPRVMFRVAHDR